MNEKELLQMANRPGKYAEIERLVESFNEFPKGAPRKKEKKTPVSFRIFDVITFLCSIVLLYLFGILVL